MVTELRIEARNLASVYTGVFKSDRMKLRGEKPITNFL